MHPSRENFYGGSKIEALRKPDPALLTDLHKLGYQRIIGIDEVGRGALAGPIIVAAIELPVYIDGVTDSKLLTRVEREQFSQRIKQNALQLKFGIVSNAEIDRLGVTKALNKAYQEALKGIKSDIVLTDHYHLPIKKRYLKATKGDRLFYPVAAASIIAKVIRDQLMRSYAQFFPNYFWEQNVGYGTKEHYRSLEEHGHCQLHRQLYLRKFITQTLDISR